MTNQNNPQSRMIELPAPLFRDPIYDAPTDPTVIWNRVEGAWYMFYTQRRSADSGEGVAWVHGTRIGVASSRDGAKWLYRGTLEGLDIERGHNTFWAPAIYWGEGEYHMYVSYITGIPTDWEYPRSILHYTSDNLWDWSYQGKLDLDSERVIDACVKQIAPGQYKMWFKEENKGSRIYAAVSPDLYHWQPVGEEVPDCAQEGPVVFTLENRIWMITDCWHGLAVYSSEDYRHWRRCGTILADQGTRPSDCGFGHHAEVVKRGDRAYLFYFTHPFLPETVPPQVKPGVSKRDACRAVVQAAELKVDGDTIVCDRNAPVYWDGAPGEASLTD